jgi:hypothetical protein
MIYGLRFRVRVCCLGLLGFDFYALGFTRVLSLWSRFLAVNYSNSLFEYFYFISEDTLISLVFEKNSAAFSLLHLENANTNLHVRTYS